MTLEITTIFKLLLSAETDFSELELQGQLNQPGRLGGQNLVECWRTDVAVGQPEVSVIQEVKELGAELELLSFGHGNVLEGGEIPVGVSGALGDIAACSPELLDGRVRIWRDALKSRRVEPGGRRFRPTVGILAGNKVWTVRRKTRDFRSAALLRYVDRIEDRKGSSTHDGNDSVELPPAQNLLIPPMRLLPYRGSPLVAQHETMTGIEQ